MLVVHKYATTKNKRALWSCVCDCGRTVLVRSSCLTRGYTTSCGCRRRAVASENFKTHGAANTRLWYIWRNMRQRCSSPKTKAYKHYGARGIKVCDEWQEFIPFRDWALANGYRDDLTIDRIDVNGDYCPKNCRWVDVKTQANNRTNNRLIEYKGQTKTLVQWCETLGLNKNTVCTRLNLYHWSTDRALSTPTGKFGS